MKRLLIISVLLFLLLLGSLYYFKDNRYTSRIKGFEVHGIDVSHYQNRINWSVLASDSLDFVFMKATEGQDFTDSLFRYNWQQAKLHGITRGAYHFFRPSTSPLIQAQHFIRTVHLESGDLPPVLDFEVSDRMADSTILKNIKQWLGAIEQHYGVAPIIYTNRAWYNRLIKGNFDEYIIWLAAYTREYPKLAEQRQWHFWQYTDRGRISGIKGDVDLNVFYSSQEVFQHIALP